MHGLDVGRNLSGYYYVNHTIMNDFVTEKYQLSRPEQVLLYLRFNELILVLHLLDFKLDEKRSLTNVKPGLLHTESCLDPLGLNNFERTLSGHLGISLTKFP